MFWVLGARCAALKLVLAALLLAGCTSDGATDSGPAEAELAPPDGWSQVDAERTFDGESIYELVNGQADAYFAYNFEDVSVRSYRDQDGNVVDVEVWTVLSPADAYGLHTSNRSGEPVAVGNGGDVDPGRRIGFWQDRAYVRVRARQETAQEVLNEFAAAVSADLPRGGDRPDLVEGLPRDGLVEGSEFFFHLESSIQDLLWLGGDNVLGLSLETDGVLARFDLAGGAALLLLVEYEGAGDAIDAVEALRASGAEGLIFADAKGSLLVAVFGDLPAADGEALVGRALGSDGD